MIVVSAVALLILMFIIQKTKVGLAIRACSYSEKASTLMGINGDLVIFIIFLMGGVLAGFAGMLYGMRFIVKPTIGQVTNKSFVAAVFGGLGSLPARSSARFCSASWRSLSRPSTPTCATCSYTDF